MLVLIELTNNYY